MSDKLDIIERLTEKINRTDHIIQSILEIQNMYILNQPKEKIFDNLLSIILEVTDSEYGFIGEIINDSATSKPFLKTYAITNIAWNAATTSFYEENVSTGLEFKNLETLFGETIKTGKVVMTNNPSKHEKSAGIPIGHPPLNAYLGVPLFVNKELVGMFGVSNRPNGFNDDLLEEIEPIIKATSNLVFAQKKRDKK